MSDVQWWETGVIYQIPVPSFADSDGDGMGDLLGIVSRLDHLNDGTSSSLNVNAVWLTPINSSPMQDFGYDVSDYYSIDPRFGTLSDFERLLESCHERGVRVVMDLALNHTSDRHPWFVESRSSRDSPKRSWYVWRDGRSPGKPPNRWVSVAEGSAWEHDRASGQYYYHAFLPCQPDLDWRNPDVRREMLAAGRFWLEKGVDGFRLDLVNFLYEDEQLRDNPRTMGTRPYFWQRHIYDRSQPESLEPIREWRRLADDHVDRVLIGEVCSDEAEDTLTYLGDGSDALHLSFYLDFARRPWRAEAFRESVGWLERRLPAAAWPCYYLNNHDLPRTFTRFGGGRHAEERAKVAAAMLLTLRGTPIIYSGEEIGMPTSRVPRKMMVDPLGRRYWPLSRGRDGSRTPMQWNAERHAGFTTGTPWLPVDASHVTRNVARQDADPDSLLNWYRRLIRLRAEHPALRAGSYRVVPDAPAGVYAYVRETGGERVAVVLNFCGRSAKFPQWVIEAAEGRLEPVLSTHDRTGVGATRTSPAKLRPYEVAVVELGGRAVRTGGGSVR